MRLPLIGRIFNCLRSHNPFEETFRRAAAAARNKIESETAVGEEKAATATGDTLNTPQIFASLGEVPISLPSANRGEIQIFPF